MRMTRMVLILTCICLPLFNFAGGLETETLLKNLYKNKNITLPSEEILQKALDGYSHLKSGILVQGNKNILTVIDFSLPSSQKRLWVIDLDRSEVLFYSHVAHGKNTGDDLAKNFSNVPNSNQSSLGFYVTGDQYVGKHGLSLRLHGLEKGVNNNAFQRAIVMHGADYVSEEFIKKHGRLGRSFGCPALSKSISKEVIETIGNGTCLFIYYPDQTYLSESAILNGRDL